jgi:hypothetical protein
MLLIRPHGSSPYLTLTFHGDTRELVRAAPKPDNTVIYPLSRRASIKDNY